MSHARFFVIIALSKSKAATSRAPSEPSPRFTELATLSLENGPAIRSIRRSGRNAARQHETLPSKNTAAVRHARPMQMKHFVEHVLTTNSHA
jgi:hypothetical protein